MIARVLRFIRFSHTVFALPFALGSMLVAARGLPVAAAVAADRALHGLRANGGDALQSAGRLGDRPAQPAHRRAHRLVPRPAGDRALHRERGALRRHHRVPQSALPLALAGRAGDRLLLLGDEALHAVQPLLSRPGALGLAGRRVARGARRLCLSAARARARRAALGGRLRPDLRHAGSRVRPRRPGCTRWWCGSASRAACALAQALHWAMLAVLAVFGLAAALPAGVLREPRRRSPARSSTSTAPPPGSTSRGSTARSSGATPSSG